MKTSELHVASPEDEFSKQLNGILILSNLMMSAAERGDWDELARIEERRRIACSKLFSRPIAPGGVMTLSDVVKEVQRLNAEIISTGEETMRSLAEQINVNRRKKAAAKIYQLHDDRQVAIKE